MVKRSFEVKVIANELYELTWQQVVAGYDQRDGQYVSWVDKLESFLTVADARSYIKSKLSDPHQSRDIQLCRITRIEI